MSDLPRSLKIATVWLVAGTALFVAVQAFQARERELRVVVREGAIEIRRAADGHYHWPGQVNGRSVEFLVDTGATRTALPAAVARELRLEAVQAVTSMTAAGPVQGTLVRVNLRLEGGLQAQAVLAVALPGLTRPLLGMDVLSRVRLQHSAGVLRVEAAPARL